MFETAGLCAELTWDDPAWVDAARVGAAAGDFAWAGSAEAETAVVVRCRWVEDEGRNGAGSAT